MKPTECSISDSGQRLSESCANVRKTGKPCCSARRCACYSAIDRTLPARPVHINCSSANVSVDTIEQRYFSLRKDRSSIRSSSCFCAKNPSKRSFSAEPSAVPIASVWTCRKNCSVTHRRQRSTRLHPRGHEPTRFPIECSLTYAVANCRSWLQRMLSERGIDVSTVSHIINFDIPLDCDDYVHRVGRTGRMGRDGIAFTFVNRRRRPATNGNRIEHQPLADSRLTQSR